MHGPTWHPLLMAARPACVLAYIVMALLCLRYGLYSYGLALPVSPCLHCGLYSYGLALPVLWPI